jgi:hypothetical protein
VIADADDVDAGLDRQLAQLPAMTPDASREARVRARCHAILSSQKARAARVQSRRDALKRFVMPAVVGVFCALYWSLLVYDALGAIPSP